MAPTRKVTFKFDERSLMPLKPGTFHVVRLPDGQELIIPLVGTFVRRRLGPGRER
jgi:hypothetical protein